MGQGPRRHDRRVLTAAGVLVRLGPGAVLSHEEAARQLDLPLVDDTGVRRVVVPRNRSRAQAEGWRLHRADLGPAERIQRADGLSVTSVLRTVVDLAKVLPLGAAVAAADGALRLGTSPVTLRAALLAARGPGAGRCRQVAALMDPLAESVLESLLRLLLVLAGLPSPVSQYEIRDEHGRTVARVDFCWPGSRLVVEADGFAFHSDRLAYRRDRERMNELERLGWRVLRFTWEDVRQRPAAVVTVVAECLAAMAA